MYKDTTYKYLFYIICVLLLLAYLLSTQNYKIFSYPSFSNYEKLLQDMFIIY